MSHPHYTAKKLVLDLLASVGGSLNANECAAIGLQLRAAVADLVEDGLIGVDQRTRQAYLTKSGREEQQR